jgi:hypothetical protein
LLHFGQAACRAEEVHPDWRALVFAVGAWLLSGLFFGLAPALRVPMRGRRTDPPQLIARLTAYLNVHTRMDHCRGKLLVVEVDRIRVRE